MSRTITSIQSASYKTDLTVMLFKELRDTANNSNPYFGPSESMIAKLILQSALEVEHPKYCGERVQKRALVIPRPQ